MRFFNLLQLLTIIVLQQLSYSVGVSPEMPRRNCTRKCGDVMIPYPFGIEEGCYYEDEYHFRVRCNETTQKPIHGGNFPLLDISVDEGFIRVTTAVAYDCHGDRFNTPGERHSRFFLSPTRNKFTGVGCDTIAALRDATTDASVGCISSCYNNDSVIDGECNRAGCCQTSDLPHRLRNFDLFLGSFNDHKDVKKFSPCSYAFLVDANEFRFNKNYYFSKALSNGGRVPTVLDWAVGRGTNCKNAKLNPETYACKENAICQNSPHKEGYNCKCPPGFTGNPYIGCQDIDECKQPEKYPCIGHCTNTNGSWNCVTNDHSPNREKHFIVIIITIGTSIVFIAVVIESCIIYKGLKKRKIRSQKRAFFERNGGLRLQDNLSQVEQAQNAFHIFTAEELETATNNFDKENIVGSGGFADVYKGSLSNGTLVAIKKPKTKSLEETENVQFINEVILLSKIQHHNVVTFLGCCLETEAPLLVYEFIQNGTLVDHLHKEDRRPGLSWETRLKIAAETAGVLAYLHCDHRPSIIHSDIKPHNILLGDDFTAKVSDFGISKMAPQNETELYTKVKGTLGYLDPEFIQSGQLSEKSDVYSFGVVLLELITGQKVLSFYRPKADWCLVNYFRTSFVNGSFTETLDRSIVTEENMNQFRPVAEIAMICVSVKAEERPNMKEVAMELGGMLMEGKSRSWATNNSNSKEREDMLNRALGLEGYTSFSSTGDSSSYIGEHIIRVTANATR